MAENNEITSLAGMASHKKNVSRSAPDAKAKSVSAKATGKGGFDGLLKTFLGKDKAGSAKGTSGSSVAGANKGKKGSSASSAGASMKPGEKKALRKSLDKTVPAGEENVHESAETVAPEDAAAALEAAQLIWNLLYGNAAGVSGAEEVYGDSLRQISDIVNAAGSANFGGIWQDALSGLGEEAVDLAALQDAMETANASAEMNNAAVLAALDDLLDGMPREALAEALDETARAMGLDESGDAFNRIAAALDAEITAVNSGLGKDLLAQLESQIISGQNNAPVAAENAGNSVSDSELLDWFGEFLTENIAENDPNSPITNTDSVFGDEAAAMFETFAGWLVETGKILNNNELADNPTGLAEAVLRASGDATASGAETRGAFGKVFSWMKGNVESALQFIESSNGAATSAESLSPSGQRGFEAGFVPGAAAAGPGGTNAAAQPAQTSAASGMLAQLENIERLSEAMRMANRGGMKNLTLQLSPPELGKVMLRVEAKDGVISAFLRVEKPEAASQLANNLSQLRENLKAQGIELGELDIQQRGQHETLGDFSGQRHRRDAESEYQSRYGAERGDSDDADDQPAQAEIAPTTKDGPLNLFA